MGGMTARLLHSLLDNMFNHNPSAPASTNMYMALSVTPLRLDGNGMSGEPTIGVDGYARLHIPNSDSTNWDDAVGGVKANKNGLAFPPATGDWGTFGYWALMNSSTASAADNVEAFGALLDGEGAPATTTVASGSQLFVPPKTLKITATSSGVTHRIKNAMLDKCFGQAATPTGNTSYLAMSETIIKSDGTGLTEPTIGVNNYSRIAIANDATDWNNAFNRRKTNSVDLAWPIATGDLGTYAYWAMLDHPTEQSSEHVECFGRFENVSGFAAPVVVFAGDQAAFQAGHLVIEVD